MRNHGMKMIIKSSDDKSKICGCGTVQTELVKAQNHLGVQFGAMDERYTVWNCPMCGTTKMERINERNGNNMRCIIINAERHEISEAKMTKPTLEYMQTVVGGRIDVAHQIDDNNAIFVNDEGMFTAMDFFEYRGAHQPFAGNGIIVGTMNNGDTGPATILLDEAKRNITF